MSLISSSRIYYIDSEERITGSASNFSYQFQIPQNEHYDHVCVLAMTIPLSYYLIRSGTNSFTLKENATNTVITIPIGNYTAISFATVLTGLLNTNSPNLWTYSVALTNSFTSVNLGKYTYTVTGNGLSQPSFIFATRICQQMGFAENSTNTFTSSTLVSTSVLDFIPSSALFLHSDMVEDSTSILQELYSNNTIPYSNHVYNCQSIEMYSKLLKTDVNNIYNFSLEDEHGVEIDLNGHSFLFTLLLYKKDDFTDIFKKYIKYNILKSDQNN
jgi:hypothetical protein